MKPILYPADQRVFDNNGYGVLSDCTECKATEVLNGEYEIQMTYPRTGNNASYISVDTIVLIKSNYIDGPQPFRIYNVEDNIDGVIQVKAAHLSYDTAGIPVSSMNVESLNDAMSAMNNNRILSGDSEFIVIADFEAEGDMKTTEPKSFKSLLGDGENTLIGSYGGELHYDGYTIELHERRGEDKGICFRYRKNITEFQMESTSEEVYTGVFGYWKKSGTNGAADVLVNGNIISTGIEASYEKILIVDTSDKIKNANDANATTAQIDDYIQSYINENKPGNPKYNMKIEYTEDDNIIKINLGDTVAALIPEFGIKAYGRCTKVVYDCLLERNESIEVGTVDTGLAGDLANII